jgi:hypothetical protein
MKFLYLVPFLSPHLVFACIDKSVTDYVGVFFNVFIIFFIPWVFLVCCSLLFMRLLPRNKGLTMSVIFAKAKKGILIGSGITLTLLVISLVGLIGFSLYQSYIPPDSESGDFVYPLC